MSEHDSNIVARLVALNERTRKAWALPHNKSFYVPASFQGFQVRNETSRKSTPFDEDSDSDGYVEESEPELRISFISRPKDISQGWTFGSDQTTCDVYCGEYDKDNDYNIGRQTFSITINKQGHVILKHINNNNRTLVQYGSQKAGNRREFTWIMLPRCKTVVVTVARLLKFKVIVAKSSAQTKLYKGLRAQFLKDAEDSMPSTPFLSVDNEATTADTSVVSTPKAQPFYYICEDKELGSGSFGQVYVVVDVSTGLEYAGKKFFDDIEESEADILAKQNHENILRYVTLSHDDGPLLVTEYLKGGNLARPWRLNDRAPWQTVQIMSFLTQALRGLASLHALPNPVIHRDIKPENILVEDREHLVEPREPGPWIKLADFGLATEGTKCEGADGTWLYLAPEAFYSQPYNSKVDVWSLGVVILQLLLKGFLPKPTTGYVQGPQWCEDVITLAAGNYYFSSCEDKLRLRKDTPSMRTLLWGFITTFMLKLDPEKRLSAQECLGHPTFLWLQSGMRAMMEAQRKDARLQSSGRVPVSVVNEGERIPEQVEMGMVFVPNTAGLSSKSSGGAEVTEPELPTNPILTSPPVTAPMPHDNKSPAAYDPGVEEAVVLKQGTQGSKTAMPQASSPPNNPQPLPYGLVLAGNHDFKPALTQVERLKARAITNSRRTL